MSTYGEWSARHPQAAEELRAMLMADAHYDPQTEGKSEAYAQQQARFAVAKLGGMAWRNNVGAGKTKEVHACPRCAFNFEVQLAPIRWGLCNDSMKLNKKLKSSDLIGVIPRLITPELVGSTIGQFVAIETKKPGWKYAGNEHEVAQMAWLQLIAGKGGVSMFSTGDVKL